jgi:membrane fusion protein, adhesin transport system
MLTSPATGALAPWSTRIRTDASTRLLWTLAAACTAFLVWASVFELDQVTRGSGRVLPSVQNQMVQHLEGGIITQILVREGQRVKKGDVLMRINNQFTEAELSNATSDVISKQIALARMEAEARGDSSLNLPAGLVEKRPLIAESERALFQSRRSQIAGEMSIIDDQIRGFQSELAQLDARIINLRAEETLLVRQMSVLERALAADAVSEAEVMDKRGNLQQLRTRIAESMNQIPRTRAELAEARGRRSDIWLRFVAENKQKIAQLRLEIAKADQAVGAFEDRRDREDVRAPMDGVINKMFVQTVGGVIKPGGELVEIVPVDKSVMIEAQLAPKDRGDVWPGLPAVVKISAYDYAIYGGLKGEVVDISPDAFQDPQGHTYYRVRLKADTSRFGGDRPVVPGMTADVDIKSGQRTVLQYLMGPVTKLRDNALRE